MKIGINALSAQTGAGISQMQKLLPELARTDQKNSYIVFYSARQRAFALVIPGQFEKVEIAYVPRNPFARVLWEQLIFPVYLAWHKVDVLYSVGNTTCILAPCKVALLMENANPYSRLKLPWSRKEQVRLGLLRSLGWLSARRATKIRFVSRNSRDLIVPRLGVDSKKCEVIPHGVANISSPFEGEVRRGLVGMVSITPSHPPEPPLGQGGKFSGRRGNPYILTIGANGPHRNTVRLLKAFSILVTRYGYGGDLMVVGNTGSHTWRGALDALVHELGLGSKVVFKDEVPHRDVGTYFNHADAFVFPSLEETFGIPLLEAMAAGVSIAAADCDLDPAYRGKCFNPFREICGDAAVYFNPFDPEDMATCIARVLADAPARAQLIVRGKEQVKKYKLEDTAVTLVQLFTDVYNS